MLSFLRPAASPTVEERSVRCGFHPLIVLSACMIFGCGTESTSATGADVQGTDVVDPGGREAGVVLAFDLSCDASDPSRCLLPWPSDVFTRVDDARVTGRALMIAPESVPAWDDFSSLERADGFSRISPIVTTFEGVLDGASVGEGEGLAITVLVSTPGDGWAEEVPLRIHVVVDEDALPAETTLVAYPRRPMRPGTEHTVVILDDLRFADGSAVSASHHVKVSLGLESPTNPNEEFLRFYHHPARQLLHDADIAPERVVRLWTFTTRSRDAPLADLRWVREEMMDAVDAGETAVQVDSVETFETGPVAMVVRGRLMVPDYVGEESIIVRDDAGLPMADGLRDAHFRVAVPVGAGDYRVIMYGHGFGDDGSDDSFDDLITEEGAAKVGIQFDQWTESGIVQLSSLLFNAVDGSARVADGLVHALSAGCAIQASMGAALGDVLSASEIAGVPNPAEGRRPWMDRVVWAGGSLGGTMGLVYAHLEPSVQAAVLNVPGTGLSHYVRFSNLYNALALILDVNYPRQADASLALAMAQTNFDRGEGALWSDVVDEPPHFLIQESMHDPVMPNIGTDLVAASVGGVFVGTSLGPIEGISDVVEMTDTQNGITQFRVDQDADPLDIHGFAAGDGLAGEAAREQIRAFINGYWEGESRIIFPEGCRAYGDADSCDFTVTP